MTKCCKNKIIELIFQFNHYLLENAKLTVRFLAFVHYKFTFKNKMKSVISVVRFG